MPPSSTVRAKTITFACPDQLELSNLAGGVTSSQVAPANDYGDRLDNCFENLRNGILSSACLDDADVVVNGSNRRAGSSPKAVRFGSRSSFSPSSSPVKSQLSSNIEQNTNRHSNTILTSSNNNGFVEAAAAANINCAPINSPFESIVSSPFCGTSVQPQYYCSFGNSGLQGADSAGGVSPSGVRAVQGSTDPAAGHYHQVTSASATGTQIQHQQQQQTAARGVTCDPACYTATTKNMTISETPAISQPFVLHPQHSQQQPMHQDVNAQYAVSNPLSYSSMGEDNTGINGHLGPTSFVSHNTESGVVHQTFDNMESAHTATVTNSQQQIQNAPPIALTEVSPYVDVQQQLQQQQPQSYYQHTGGECGMPIDNIDGALLDGADTSSQGPTAHGDGVVIIGDDGVVQMQYPGAGVDYPLGTAAELKPPASDEEIMEALENLMSKRHILQSCDPHLIPILSTTDLSADVTSLCDHPVMAALGACTDSLQRVALKSKHLSYERATNAILPGIGPKHAALVFRDVSPAITGDDIVALVSSWPRFQTFKKSTSSAELGTVSLSEQQQQLQEEVSGDSRSPTAAVEASPAPEEGESTSLQVLPVLSVRSEVAGFWIVVLSDEALTQDIAFWLRGQSIKGEELKVRIKSESTVRLAAMSHIPLVARVVAADMVDGYRFHDHSGRVAVGSGFHPAVYTNTNRYGGPVGYTSGRYSGQRGGRWYHHQSGGNRNGYHNYTTPPATTAVTAGSSGDVGYSNNGNGSNNGNVGNKKGYYQSRGRRGGVYGVAAAGGSSWGPRFGRRGGGWGGGGYHTARVGPARLMAAGPTSSTSATAVYGVPLSPRTRAHHEVTLRHEQNPPPCGPCLGFIPLLLPAAVVASDQKLETEVASDKQAAEGAQFAINESSDGSRAKAQTEPGAITVPAVSNVAFEGECQCNNCKANRHYYQQQEQQQETRIEGLEVQGGGRIAPIDGGGGVIAAEGSPANDDGSTSLPQQDGVNNSTAGLGVAANHYAGTLSSSPYYMGLPQGGNAGGGHGSNPIHPDSYCCYYPAATAGVEHTGGNIDNAASTTNAASYYVYPDGTYSPAMLPMTASTLVAAEGGDGQTVPTGMTVMEDGMYYTTQQHQAYGNGRYQNGNSRRTDARDSGVGSSNGNMVAVVGVDSGGNGVYFYGGDGAVMTRGTGGRGARRGGGRRGRGGAWISRGGGFGGPDGGRKMYASWRSSPARQPQQSNGEPAESSVAGVSSIPQSHLQQHIGGGRYGSSQGDNYRQSKQKFAVMGAEQGPVVRSGFALRQKPQTIVGLVPVTSPAEFPSLLEAVKSSPSERRRPAAINSTTAIRTTVVPHQQQQQPQYAMSEVREICDAIPYSDIKPPPFVAEALAQSFALHDHENASLLDQQERVISTTTVLVTEAEAAGGSGIVIPVGPTSRRSGMRTGAAAAAFETTGPRKHKWEFDTLKNRSTAGVATNSQGNRKKDGFSTPVVGVVKKAAAPRAVKQAPAAAATTATNCISTSTVPTYSSIAAAAVINPASSGSKQSFPALSTVANGIVGAGGNKASPAFNYADPYHLLDDNDDGDSAVIGVPKRMRPTFWVHRPDGMTGGGNRLVRPVAASQDGRLGGRLVQVGSPPSGAERESASAAAARTPQTAVDGNMGEYHESNAAVERGGLSAAATTASTTPISSVNKSSPSIGSVSNNEDLEAAAAAITSTGKVAPRPKTWSSVAAAAVTTTKNDLQNAKAQNASVDFRDNGTGASQYRQSESHSLSSTSATTVADGAASHDGLLTLDGIQRRSSATGVTGLSPKALSLKARTLQFGSYDDSVHAV